MAFIDLNKFYILNVNLNNKKLFNWQLLQTKYLFILLVICSKIQIIGVPGRKVRRITIILFQIEDENIWTLTDSTYAVVDWWWVKTCTISYLWSVVCLYSQTFLSHFNLSKYFLIFNNFIMLFNNMLFRGSKDSIS